MSEEGGALYFGMREFRSAGERRYAASAVSRHLIRLSSLNGLLRNPHAPALKTRARILASGNAVCRRECGSDITQRSNVS